jgi:hypothetical protein
VDSTRPLSPSLRHTRSASASRASRIAIAANGNGLEFDPIIVHAHLRNELKVMKRGTGKVTLKATPHDPLPEIEIVELKDATYSERDIDADAKAVGTIAAEKFLPFAFQNIETTPATSRVTICRNLLSSAAT